MAHKQMGYDGIFITNHFFNGNTSVPKNLPWCKRVEQFCSGFEEAKRIEKKVGIQVFFGFEYGVNGADFLIYNLDKEWLKEHEDIDCVKPREAFSLFHKDGGFIVHAHPFRERDYIDHIQLYPRDVDAVEVINGSHPSGSKFDERAKKYAKMYGLCETAGSDTHHTDCLYGSYILTPQPIRKVSDYLHFMKLGVLTLCNTKIV